MSFNNWAAEAGIIQNTWSHVHISGFFGKSKLRRKFLPGCFWQLNIQVQPVQAAYISTENRFHKDLCLHIMKERLIPSIVSPSGVPQAQRQSE